MQEVLTELGTRIVEWLRQHALNMVAILVGAWLAHLVFRFVLSRVARWLERRYGERPAVKEAIDTILGMLRLSWLVALLAAVVALELMELGVRFETLKTPLRMVLIVAVAWVANRAFGLVLSSFSRWMKERFGERRETAVRIDTLASVLRFTWLTALWVVVVTMELAAINVPIAPLLAGAGIVGLAVGFGAQSLVKDVITGFFLLLENHYGVGDVVNIAGTGGLVEAMNLRFTTLRALDGTVHSIPHGEVTTVSNLTRGWSRVLINLGVDYDANPDRVIEVLKDECKRFHQDETFGSQLLEEPEVTGIEELGDSAVVYRILAKTVPMTQWGAMRELRRRLLIRLQQEGITIPFPQRMLSFRDNGSLAEAFAGRTRSGDA